MFQRITTVFAVAMLLNGCSLRAPMKRFSTQEQAGTVHVAVQSIARFDDAYTDQLQPHFDLTSEQALNAISQTQVSEMERLRVLLAELNIAGQKRTVTSERTLTKGEVTTETATEKTDAPDLETVPNVPTAKGLSNNAPGITPTEKVQLDQSLRYRAAAALMQEIALFNRYVRDAAVSRGTIPYVVRLLVTVNPAARREPYDVYTTISFFSGGKSDYQGEVADLVAYYAKAQKTEPANIERALKVVVPDTACDRAMEIIPLFVTDNLESSFNSSANERILDGSAAGSGFFANFAALFGFRGQSVDRDRSLSRAINGLTTISRLGNNTIMARLGAANANNDYEMVARTYNVTLLALVPTTAALRDRGASWAYGNDMLRHLNKMAPCSDFNFTAYSKFRDAVRGTEVPTSFEAQRDRVVANILKSWQFVDPKTGKANDSATNAMSTLLVYAQMGRDVDFAAKAKEYAAGALNSPIVRLEDPFVRNMLWHDLVRVTHVSGRSYGRFQLPARTTHFFTEQPVTLFDDGKKTTVILNGARNLASDGFHAQIHAKSGAEEVWLDDVVVAISDDRRRATITFPSVKARLGSSTSFDKLELTAKKIESGARGELATTDIMEAKAVTYRLIEPARTPDPTKMGITSDSIRIKEGIGEFAVAFVSDKNGIPPAVRLEIAGGMIATVTPAAPFIDGGLEVQGQGNYVIALKNLFEGTPVTVRALLGDKTVVGEKTLTVKP